MRRIAVVVCFLSLSPLVQADSLPIGTWVKRDPSPGTALTMTVEQVGNGRKLTYKYGPDAPGMVTVVLTQLDGKDVPILVDGKPTDQTMGIRMIDSRHTFTVLKFQGKETGIAKSEVSADGKVLKVEIMMATPGVKEEGAKAVEYWDKK
jgi:hypothetical protein